MLNHSPILCSTARLARALRLRRPQSTEANSWQPGVVLSLSQWLTETLTHAQLRGEIPADALPQRGLEGMAESLLWEEVIGEALSADPAHALFDLAGMARSAAEANAWMLEWGVAAPEDRAAEETRQFLRWRQAFQLRCKRLNALEPASLFEQQIACMRRGAGRLPAALQLAGFDRVSPQLQRLIDALSQRGVQVSHLNIGLDAPALLGRMACDDAEAECRAAVAWAADRLRANPTSRLAIVTPDLAGLRGRLTALLDDALHPETLLPRHAERARCYDVSLGEPLSAVPLAQTALALLRLAVGWPGRMPQRDMGWLLRDPYWSAGMAEADARAALDAEMRRHLSASLSPDAWLRFSHQHAARQGLPLRQLLIHLEAMRERVSAWPRRQAASAWGQQFAALLQAVGWPGERKLSSHEFQAREAWQELLAQFGALDGLLGRLNARQACSHLARFARERIFQPESPQAAQLVVSGMLESSAEPLDGLWVMGMNDHAWPPPARPNPLLPAGNQRAAGSPNACGRVQAAFAQVIHARLLRSAPTVVFSWARKADERELRISPLLADLPDLPAISPSQTLAELLATPAKMQWLEDALAPPLAAGEGVKGGASLLRAQAFCPAWGFYRYRLVARALETPTEGLDASERGNLLHAALQALWQGRDSAWLATLDAESARQAISAAVAHGVQQCAAQREIVFPPHFLALEQARLEALLAAWLMVERQRSAFSVLECERRLRVQVGNLAVDMVLDRVDRLPDGRLVVLDYKTAAAISTASWAEARITEPQLPLYAALGLNGDAIAAVSFAKIRAEEQKFVGISAEAEMLPGVPALEDARKGFPAEQFPTWQSVLSHWHARLTAMADEICRGEAAVTFTRESDLLYCEVRPLLRLPERKLQRERGA